MIENMYIKPSLVTHIRWMEVFDLTSSAASLCLSMMMADCHGFVTLADCEDSMGVADCHDFVTWADCHNCMMMMMMMMEDQILYFLSFLEACCDLVLIR